MAGAERSEPPEGLSPGGSPLVPRGSTPATRRQFPHHQITTRGAVPTEIAVACAEVAIHCSSSAPKGPQFSVFSVVKEEYRYFMQTKFSSRGKAMMTLVQKYLFPVLPDDKCKGS